MCFGDSNGHLVGIMMDLMVLMEGIMESRIWKEDR